jgi:ribonuclease HII
MKKLREQITLSKNKAPQYFSFQKTVIKGDEKIPVISLASIAAKVLRDRKMVIFAKQYPKYGFEIHKGYGTTAHRKAIRKFGPSAIHRKSFLSRIA